MRRWRLRKIEISWWRWNEYTRWRPRVDRGDGFTTLVVGPFALTVVVDHDVPAEELLHDDGEWLPT